MTNVQPMAWPRSCDGNRFSSQDLSPKTVPPAHSKMLMAQELLFLVDFVVGEQLLKNQNLQIQSTCNSNQAPYFNIKRADIDCYVCLNSHSDHLCLYFETELCGATQACLMESEDRRRTENSRYPENTSG